MEGADFLHVYPSSRGKNITFGKKAPSSLNRQSFVILTVSFIMSNKNAQEVRINYLKKKTYLMNL